MVLKKSDLYSSLWNSCDELRGSIENGFTRGVTKIGHFGAGNLEVAIESAQHLERAQPLIQASYQRS